MIRRLGPAATLTLVIFIFATAVHAAAQVAPPLATTDVNQLLGSAYANGSVRVIVKLKPAGIVPEAELRDTTAIAQQRTRITDHQNAAIGALAGTRYRIHWRYRASAFLALEVSPDALRILAASPLVESIVEDIQLVPLLNRSGPLVQADSSHAAGITGTGQTVVIIDTGVDGSHPFLSGRIVEEWCFSSPSGCPNGTGTQSGSGAAAPVQGHGTHVAGIAAGAGVTFSGMAPASGIIPVRVFPSVGRASFSDVKKAVDQVITLMNSRTIAAVNLSLGTAQLFSSSCDATDAPFGMKADIDALRSSGIATVVAAGNDGASASMSYPACLSNTIKVGASTNNDTIAVYSDRLPSLEATTLFAPGGDAASINVCSSFPPGFTSPFGVCSNPATDGAFWYDAGTSMATPHVAGAWGLLKQVKPTATVDEVLAALRATAVPIFDAVTGTTYKRIRIRDAVGALTNLSANLVPSVTAPQQRQTTITFTANTTGGVGPLQYKWWVFDGTTWTIARDWSLQATFNWTPAVANPNYRVGVWVKSGTITGDTYDRTESTASMTFPIVTSTLRLDALTSDLATPQPPQSTITFVAAASGGFAPYQYKWWIFDGTTWSVAMDWSSQNTFRWTPAVANPSYRIGVWVRSVNNPDDIYDRTQSTGTVPFEIGLTTTLQTLTADKTPPQVVGTAMTFTATATGGTAPLQYKWWIFDGTTWSVTQDWSPRNTFAWTPRSANPNYQVGVWIRSNGVTADVYDRRQSTGSMAFAITTSDLTVTSLTSDLPPPRVIGTAITFTAAASGGTAPLQYKWWVFDGTTWTVARDWSTANTFRWVPTVANANYRVGVWAKSSTTPGDTYDRLESTSNVPFAIDVSDLTVTAITPDKSAPQPAWTMTTFTATTTGGVGLIQFKWWVFDGVTWTMAQDWSSSRTFSWIPSRSSTNYSVGVWAKSGATPGDTYDRPQSTGSIAFAISPPTLTLTSLTANLPPPQPLGTPITFTATATGGIAPLQYKWWVFDGSTWTVARDWSTANTFAWSPATGGSSYMMGVWARSATNGTDLYDRPEATASMPFAITGPAQVRFLNNLCLAPSCTPFTGRLSTVQGYVWLSVSGSYSPYQPVGSSIGTFVLSGFVLEALGTTARLSFNGSLSVTAGRKYTLVATVDAGGNVVLGFIDEGTAALSTDESAVPVGALPGTHTGDSSIQFTPMPRMPLPR